MSTIHDALKKTQKNIHANDSSSPGATPQTGDARFSPPPKEKSPSPAQPAPAPAAKEKRVPPETQEPRPGKNRRIIMTFLVIFFLAGFVLLFLSISSTHLLSPNMATAPEQPAGFTLQGIMSMPEKTVALINDEIYEVGDLVSGMKLIKIETDSVTLLKAGKVMTLKVDTR